MTTKRIPKRLERNNRCILSILFAIITMTILPVYGRIGETPEQCKKRYGEPSSLKGSDPEATYLSYKKGDFDIQVTFFNGKAVEIIYIKKGAFNSDEVDHLMKVNGIETRPEIYPKRISAGTFKRHLLVKSQPVAQKQRGMSIDSIATLEAAFRNDPTPEGERVVDPTPMFDTDGSMNPLYANAMSSRVGKELGYVKAPDMSLEFFRITWYQANELNSTLDIVGEKYLDRKTSLERTQEKANQTKHLEGF